MNNTDLTRLAHLAHLAFSCPGEMQVYSVNFWGSDPAKDNDDCWTGVDFANRVDAEAFYADPFAVWAEAHRLGLTTWSARSLKRDTAFVQIDGVDVHMTRPTHTRVRTGSSQDQYEERRELAMEAGMLGGCDAYNDAMGY